jgi:hypothetical protein
MATVVARRPRRPGTFHAAAVAGVLPLALSLIPAGSPPGAACGVHCGKERWSVKTMSDAGAAAVLKTTPRPATVSSLVLQRAPLAPAAETRVSDLEQQVYTVTALLVGYKQEKDDRDFHIVIRDLQSEADTMIVEIPDTDCAGVCASVAHDDIFAARSAFATAFAAAAPNESFRTLATPLTVTVTGVPLFDFFHDQTGVAKNCIELHPVLKIELPPGPLDTKADPSKKPKNGPSTAYTCVPRGSE